MQLAHEKLNGNFGARVEDVCVEDLYAADFREAARALWYACGGLLAVRGPALAGLSPQALMDWASAFGVVDQERLSAREFCTIEGYPIIRLGNTKDASGHSKATFAEVPRLTSDADVVYNPNTLRPVWHTDSTFRCTPPVGSVFHCKMAPTSGGDTLFANARGAFAALDEDTQEELRKLEAVCSLAHHDKKVNLYSPEYPVLNAEQRAANPPNRVPIVLEHPVTGEPALYGMNSSTCAVVPRGAKVTAEQMDVFDLEGREDDSVFIWRRMLPHVTAPQFTVRWQWQAGDIVVWDNRCTLHAATGFDHQREQREMWRLTLAS